jgi:hypothetical protein
VRESQSDFLPIITSETANSILQNLGINPDKGILVRTSNGTYANIEETTADLIREEFIKISAHNRLLLEYVYDSLHQQYPDADLLLRHSYAGIALVSAAYSKQVPDSYFAHLESASKGKKLAEAISIIKSTQPKSHIPDILDEVLHCPMIPENTQPDLSNLVKKAANRIDLGYADRVRAGAGTMYQILTGIWIPMTLDFPNWQNQKTLEGVSEYIQDLTTTTEVVTRTSPN